MDIRNFNQAIRSFDNSQQELGINFDKAIVTLNGKKLAIDKPLMAPSRWTSFLGSLSSNAVLGKWQSVINAKKTCDAYASYTANTNAVREGFIKALNAQYDKALSSLCELPPANGKPLSAKTIAITLATIKKNCPPHNNKRINIFADKLLATLETEKKLPTLDKQNKTMLEDAILARCKKLDSYSTEMVETKDMFVEAEKVISFYSALRREVAGTDISPTQKAEIFKQLCELPDPTAALPKTLILSSAESMLKDNSPASKLNQLALQNGVSQDLVKTIAQAKLEQLVDNISNTPSSGFKQLEMAFIDKIKTALSEHAAALEILEKSSQLTNKQKIEVRQIALSVPLDRAQIAQFELFSTALKTPASTESKSQAEPQASELITLENALSVLKQSEGQGWMADSSNGSDKRMYGLIQRLVSVAVAGLNEDEVSKAQAKLNERLTEETGHVSLGASLYSVWRPAMDTVLMQALTNKSQGSAQPVEKDFLTQKSQVKGRDQTIGGVTQKLSEILSKQGEMDERGFIKGKTETSHVTIGFRAGDVFSAKKNNIVDYIKGDLIREDGLSELFNKDLMRSDFSINGKLINGDRASSNPQNSEVEDVGKRKERLAIEYKKTAIDDLTSAGADKATLTAISQCMNQLGITMFLIECNKVAMSGATVGQSLNNEVNKTQHEVWAQKDGSWIVRSTNIYEPNVIARSDRTIQIDPGSTGLYSLTYRITPQAGDEAQITLEGYTAAYDF